MRRLLRGGVWAALLMLVSGAGWTLTGQEKYTGPRPAKADVPYLKHVDNLIELESGQAQQSEEKSKTVYRVAGATSMVRTPMAEPILLFQTEKVNPDKLSLYKMEVAGGQRTLSLSTRRDKDSPKSIHLSVKPLDRGLFKIEVNEFIDDGEYCLSPDGSNAVFCFTTY